MGGGRGRRSRRINNPRFKAGEFVVGPGGWQHYVLINDGAGFNVVDARAIPPQAYLGVVGMPGVTAWYGLNKIIAPRPAKRSWSPPRPARSAAWSANSPGSQARKTRRHRRRRGKMRLCHETNSVSTPASITSRARFRREMKAALPNGLDGLFENVGRRAVPAMPARLNDFARIAICGLIASYEGAPTVSAGHAAVPGPAHPDRGLHRLRPPADLAAGAERTRRTCRLRPTALSRNGARRGWKARRRRSSTCCTAAILARCW